MFQASKSQHGSAIVYRNTSIKRPPSFKRPPRIDAPLKFAKM